MVFPFLSLYLTGELLFSESEAGELLSVYGIGSFVGVYFAGRMLAKVGAIRLNIVFLVITTGIYLVLPFLFSWWDLVIGIFVWAVFSEGTRPAMATAIANFAPEDVQTRAYGLRRLAVNLGMSFGPAIGGVLATISFVYLFIVDAATTLVAAGVLIVAFGIKRIPVSDRPIVEEPTTETPLKDKYFVAFLFLTLLGSLSFFQFGVTYPLYLRDHFGMSKPGIGAIYAVNTLIIVLFEMIILEAVEKISSMIKWVGFGTLIYCVGFGILPLNDTIPFAIFAIVLVTIGEMLALPVASGWVAKRSEGKNRSMYMSWFTLTFSVTAILAPKIGGSLYEYDRDLLWFVVGATGFVAMAGYWVLDYALRREVTA